MRVQDFITGCLKNLCMLYHCRLGPTFWGRASPLEMAIAHSSVRSRRVPAMFKKAVVESASNIRGKGIRRPGQLLVGMMASKRAKGLPVIVECTAGVDFERFNAWNYWLSLRHATSYYGLTYERVLESVCDTV